jgi:phage shock protein C
MIFGVCAGIGDRFGWNLTTIRVIAVLALILFPGTLLIYLTAGILLPAKRLTYHGSRERRLWERSTYTRARSR